MGKLQNLTEVSHPAPFRDEHLKVVRDLLHYLDVTSILDPFAGTGKIHELRNYGYLTYGIEREPEWATQNSMYTIVGDVLDPAGLQAVLARAGWGTFDAVVTSPCFGNRMADHHNAKDDSVRNTYRHKLGREITEGSSAILQWGPEYRSFHEKAWEQILGVADRFFILNIKDHVRAGEVMPVTAWHVETIEGLGFQEVRREEMPTRGLAYGENHEVRVPMESMILFGRAKPRR